jgi:hypothetical protein
MKKNDSFLNDVPTGHTVPILEIGPLPVIPSALSMSFPSEKGFEYLIEVTHIEEKMAPPNYHIKGSVLFRKMQEIRDEINPGVVGDEEVWRVRINLKETTKKSESEIVRSYDFELYELNDLANAFKERLKEKQMALKVEKDVIINMLQQVLSPVLKKKTLLKKYFPEYQFNSRTLDTGEREPALVTLIKNTCSEQDKQ